MDFGWLVYLWIVPVLGLLVFMHELGHFVTARLNGIRVDEFGFGFPPRMFGIKRGGVIYSINWIPVGGFVRIYGENGEDADAPGSFGSKAPWRRAIVLAAGASMNVVLAFILFAIIAMMGMPVYHGAKVADVVSNSPAATAGLQKGDVIKSIAGGAVKEPNDVTRLIHSHTGQPVTFVLVRNGQQITRTLTPRVHPPAGQGAVGISIAPVSTTTQRYNPIAALGEAAAQVIATVVLMVTGIAQLITGRASGSGLAGPVGIAQLTGEVARTGQAAALLSWTALLSLNLFLVNLLPLPALDGGRLVFVIIEWIRGKKVSPQREAVVHAIGMMVLLSFLVVISFFDVQRIVEGKSLLP